MTVVVKTIDYGDSIRLPDGTWISINKRLNRFKEDTGKLFIKVVSTENISKVVIIKNKEKK